MIVDHYNKKIKCVIYCIYPVAAYSIFCCKSSQKVFYFICEAFTTYEEGVEVDAEKEHQVSILLKEYQSILKAEGESSIADTLDLINGWERSI